MILPVRGWFLTVVFLPYEHWVAKGEGEKYLPAEPDATTDSRCPSNAHVKYQPRGGTTGCQKGLQMECPTGPGTRSRPGWNPAPLPGDSGEPSAELTERGRTIAISRPEERGQREARKSGGWLPLTTRPQRQEIIKNDFACPGLVSDRGI